MDRMELYYNIIRHIDDICTILICAYCCTVWTRPFLVQRKKAWMAGGAYAAVMLVLTYLPWYINNILAYIIGSLTVFIVMSLIDKKYIYQKLFVAITFFCLRWQAFRIVIYVNNEINGLIYQFLFQKMHFIGFCMMFF